MKKFRIFADVNQSFSRVIKAESIEAAEVIAGEMNLLDWTEYGTLIDGDVETTEIKEVDQRFSSDDGEGETLFYRDR